MAAYGEVLVPAHTFIQSIAAILWEQPLLTVVSGCRPSAAQMNSNHSKASSRFIAGETA